jgi:membrane-bound metal-dependent hydrolase YbcI (DUF457 family)
MWYFKQMKYVLALLADWANGLFALTVALYFIDAEFGWWMLPVALLLSHLPDIDAVPELLRRGKVSASAENERDHRTLLHYPVLAAVLCIPLALYGGFWGFVVAIVVPLHLLNDLYGTGWGLPLFWPFSQRHYKLLGRRVNRLKFLLVQDGDWETLPHDERQLRLLVSWSPAEFPGYLRQWGVDDWIELWYLRLNWVSGVEYVLFLLACILFALQIT